MNLKILKYFWTATLCSSISCLKLDHLLVKNMPRYAMWVAINITNTNWQMQLVWSVGHRHIVNVSNGVAGECSRTRNLCLTNAILTNRGYLYPITCWYSFSAFIDYSLPVCRISSEKTFNRNSSKGDHPLANLVTIKDSSKRESILMQHRKLTRLSAQALNAGSSDSASRWICQQSHLRRHEKENFMKSILCILSKASRIPTL
jgi:hypothetical protein